MYRAQVIELLKDKLALEVETVSYYNLEDQYKERYVIRLCLSGKTISTVDLEKF